MEPVKRHYILSYWSDISLSPDNILFHSSSLDLHMLSFIANFANEWIVVLRLVRK